MFNNQEGQEQKEFELFDAITLASFIAQINNISEDAKQTQWIQKVILALAFEVEKLHKENEIIQEQNKKIIKMLEELIDGIN